MYDDILGKDILGKEKEKESKPSKIENSPQTCCPDCGVGWEDCECEDSDEGDECASEFNLIDEEEEDKWKAQIKNE